MTGLRITHYDWPGGREAMLRFGPDHGPTVIAALPLFEEANRTRAAMIDVLRRLAAAGIGGALPDLPGTGESAVETSAATLTDWQAAFAAAAASLPRPVHAVTWRGGALVASTAIVASCWQLAPQTGGDLMRELRRIQAAGGDEDTFAGNSLSPVLLAELEVAAPATHRRLRVARLASDVRHADARFRAAPPWRAAEPTTDQALQAAIADDVAAWIRSCAAR